MKYKIKNFLKTLYSFFEMINLKYKKLYDGRLKKILQFFPSNIYLLLLFIILSISLTSRLLNNYTIIYSTGTGAKVESEIVDKRITKEIDKSNLYKI